MNTYIPEGLSAWYNSSDYDGACTGYNHNRLESLKFTLDCYKHYKAGADYDLIVVDNNSPPQNATLNLFKSLDVPVYIRENTYYSFGAYKYAWDRYGKNYDYFVFHEMDWCPSKSGWLKDLIDYWNSDNQIGMIGNLVEEHSQDDANETVSRIVKFLNPNRQKQYNLDSEYLFTDKVILEQMENNGGWNLFPCEPETDETPVINELGMQQPILEMGYNLACFNDGKHTMFYSIYNREFPSNKWNYGLDKLSPFVPEQTRMFCPEMQKYFEWYKGASSVLI